MGAIDSTADLLFRIGADSSNAESNVQRFRMLLSKDLSDIGGEFEGWATKVFGSVTTVGGAMTAGAAVLGAGLVAAGAAAVHMADQYEQYVESVARGSKVTGIAVEDMSRLKFAAEMTGGDFDGLSVGLAKFTTAVVKGAQGSQQQLEAFQRMGISQKDLQAGEENMLPLLGQVAEHFSNLKNKTDQTAEARDLFGRSGTQFINFLKLGKDGLKSMADEADRLHLIITEKDVEALHEYKAALAEHKATQEAVDMQVGRATLPLLTNLQLAWAGLIQTIRTGGIGAGAGFFGMWGANMDVAREKVDALREALGKIGKNHLETPPGTEKVKADFEGLSAILEQIKIKLADLSGNEEVKAAEELNRIVLQMDKAMESLREKNAKGDLKAGVFDEQIAAWEQAAELLPALYAETLSKIRQKQVAAEDETTAELKQKLAAQQQQTLEVRETGWNQEMEGLIAKLQKEKQFTAENYNLVEDIRTAGLAKLRSDQANADHQADVDLDKRLAGTREKTLHGEHAQWDAEIDELWIGYALKFQLTTENEAKLAALRVAGHEKIDRDQQAAFDVEIANLRVHLEKIRSEQQTGAQRIEATYADDVAKFTAAEERKALKASQSEAQRTQIVQAYAAIRAALFGKEQADLQALRNSTGWQGVFGSEFAQMIRGNEALTKEWASSTNQSLMMVRGTMEGLRETGQKAFGSFAQGMGQNIASAIVYKKSIGDAARAAAASTLESIGAESIGWAIYSTALGFTRLAQHDYPGATAAFTSAAIWGSVGVAASVAGMAIAPSQAGAGAPAGSAAGASGAAGSAGDSTGSTVAQSGQRVTVNIMGHVIGVSGIQELTAAINDAVLNKDVQLTATNTKNGVQVTR